MQRTMSSEELLKYTSQIKDPSKDFKLFLHDYVTGNTWIRSRGEENITIWDKLKGIELEIAKQIILDELMIIPDFSYIRAVGFFKDERAVPILKNIIVSYPEKCIAEKLFSAKILYDLTGYIDYVPMLETACKNHKDKMSYDYLKVSISQFVDGLEETDKVKIMKALEENS